MLANPQEKNLNKDTNYITSKKKGKHLFPLLKLILYYLFFFLVVHKVLPRGDLELDKREERTDIITAVFCDLPSFTQLKHVW